MFLNNFSNIMVNLNLFIKSKMRIKIKADILLSLKETNDLALGKSKMAEN